VRSEAPYVLSHARNEIFLLRTRSSNMAIFRTVDGAGSPDLRGLPMRPAMRNCATRRRRSLQVAPPVRRGRMVPSFVHERTTGRAASRG
jgi:hypothetical protein